MRGHPLSDTRHTGELPPDDAAVYGVICGLAHGASPAHYVGVISTTGYRRISRYEGPVDNVPRQLVEATGPAPAIRGDGPNRITMDCAGSGAAHSLVALSLAVNGVKLGEATDADGLLPVELA